MVNVSTAGRIYHTLLMEPKNAKKELEKFIKSAGTSIESLTPEMAMDIMLEFYEQVRASNCPIDEDGDMLLYQWGVYDDMGGGRTFHFDMTRQFMVPDADDEDGMTQLSLTLFFEATPELSEIEEGNEWCATPDDIEDFRDFVESSAAFEAVSVLTPETVKIEYGPV